MEYGCLILGMVLAGYDVLNLSKTLKTKDEFRITEAYRHREK